MKTKKDIFAFWFYILIAALVVANSVWMMAGIEGPLGSRGARALRYFTVDSNILMGVAAVIAAVLRAGKKSPLWMTALLLVSAASVMLTFLVVALFLSPLVPTGYFSLFRRYNFCLHFLIPVLGALAFIFFEDARRLRFRANILSLIPVGLYAIYYIVPIMLTAAPDGTVDRSRDWYYFFALGTKMLVPVVLIIGGLAFGISVALRALGKARAKASERRAARE
jgi:hypothetical protein